MSRFCLTFGLFLSVLARPLSTIAAEPSPSFDPSDPPLVAPAVQQAMQDRDYPAARKAIDAALQAKDAPADYLAYLHAWSLHLDKQDDRAVAALEKFEKDFPQSSWLRRARFAKAQTMVAKGDFRGAQAIYESEGKYLLSDERRQRSADVYLEFGDAKFQPPHKDQKPDYRAAQQFYTLALNAGLKGPREAEVEFRIGICYQKLGANPEALKSFSDFLKKHADDARLNEVRYRLGQCYLAAGKQAEARKTWRELAASPFSGHHVHMGGEKGRVRAEEPKAQPASPSSSAVLPKGEGRLASEATVRDWPAEAAFHLAETWHFPAPSDEEELRRGTVALRDFIARYPDHELAGHAQLEIAASQAHLKRYDDAIATLKAFLADPRGKERKERADAQRTLGNIYGAQKQFTAALAAWREYLARYSSDEGASAVEQAIIDAQYAMAIEKFKLAEYDAAAKLLTEFIGRYPLDERNPEILYLFGEMQARQEHWEAAIAAWERLAVRYPTSAEARWAETAIARTLDEKLGRYEEALEQYRKIGDAGAAAAIAARRVEVETEHVFRSGEPPRLKLATRNVESVNVRAYKIDLESYFRKMHSVAGIERLDVSLIDPDATFDFRIPGYAKYKPLTSQIPVPLPGGSSVGAAAVTVGTPAQEATTLVIQSDLGVVLRASRDEMLVFAENLRTGKPWPGVRLLVSNGTTVFAEEKTGDDGFFVRAYPELRSTQYLRLFAAAEGGHVASTAVQLNGTPRDVKSGDPLFAATDQTTYQPGTIVHVYGALRHIDREHLVVEPGKKLSVEWCDAADRLLRRERVSLSPLGTFACDVPLPRELPVGKYKIVASDDAGRRDAAQFQVALPEEEHASLVIDLPRTVYHRGETVEGTFRARLPQGLPLVGAKVQYSLGGKPAGTATTDAQGAAGFSLATEDFEGDSQKLTATVVGRQLSAAAEISLARRGFSIDLATTRPVFVLGEEIIVKVDASDAEGKAVARKLTVKTTRLQTVGEETRDEAVDEQTITTTADEPARLKLKPAKAGKYTLRASGVDRFGNAIEDTLQVRVIGEHDPERLLLLADEVNLKAGDTAQMQIYWRGEPVTAIVTTHSDRLLDRRLVELHKGLNPLRVPVTAALAPGFVLGVTVMEGVDRPVLLGEKVGLRAEEPKPASTSPPVPLAEEEGSKFHTAQCEFTVKANLQVKLDCHARGNVTAKPRPGEPVEVTVTTRDAQGKPVVAEVMLAALPSGLAPSAGEFCEAAIQFLPQQAPMASYETASSAQFRYRPMNRVLGGNATDSDTSPAPHVPAESDPFAGTVVPGKSGQHAAILAQRGAAPERRPQSAKPEADDPFGPAAPAPRAPAAEDPFGDAVAPAKPGGDKTINDRNSGSSQNEESPFDRDNPNVVGEPRKVLPLARPEWPGYWNAAIKTGSDGRATIVFTPPGDLHEMVLSAQAVAASNLASNAWRKVELKTDLAAEIYLPSAVTDGDEIEVPIAVRSDLLDKGPIEVELTTNADGMTWSEKKTLAAAAGGRLETSFRPTIRQRQRPDKADGCLPVRPEAEFILRVQAGGKTAVVRRRVPLLPYGEECRVTAAGTIAGDATFGIRPARAHWTAPTLQIAVSPNIERSLLDTVDPAVREEDRAAEAAGLIRPAADLMAAVSLAKLYKPDSPEGGMLAERIRDRIALLVATQPRDGREATRAENAMAHWALTLAKKAGYEVPRESLVASLAEIRRDPAMYESDSTAKAIELHALAISGSGDFDLANQLLRDRHALSPLARGFLALALVQMDRKETAADLLKDVRSGGFSGNFENTPLQAEAARAGGKMNAEAEAVTALAILALDPADPRAKPLVDDVLAQRTGLRWNSDAGTGLAVLAATEWLAHNRSPKASVRVTITVNGKELTALELDPRAPTQTVDVPMLRLVKGKQRIAIHVAGGGRIAYRAAFTGVNPAENVAGTSAAWHVERSYEPPLMEQDGQPIARGFSVLGGDLFFVRFTNRMTQLPAAKHGFVELSIWCNRAAAERDELWAGGRGQDVTIVEPLPAGARVVESSIAGPFDRAEVLPGRIVFHLRHSLPTSTIRYELEGAFPGTDLISPTLLYRADGGGAPLAVAQPKSLAVLPQGAQSTDPYRLSPDELLALADAARAKGDTAVAMRYYGELFESWNGHRGWGLEEPALKKTVFALMELGMGRAEPAKLVQYCELIREKWPDEPVTLDQLLTAAGAYRQIGELERSYMACRAAVEGSFTNESGIAGFLENQGEFLRGVRRMNELLRDYPPEGYVAEAQFDLAQRVYAKAAEAQSNPPPQPQLRREALIERAARMLNSFLTAFPGNPSADQAAFAAANAQLDLKHYAEAAAAASDYARRYPKSNLLDSYWYILAYCDFALGRYPTAIDMCRKVAQAEHLDKESGRMVESQNKYRAIYILGQIYQSLNERAAAIREYRRVEDRIADAKSSVALFARKEFSLPECTTLRPGAPAEVELRYHNVAACDVKLYRVDLMKFSEASQRLGDLSRVNLAGIRPLEQLSVPLAGSDYADHAQKLKLPLTKEGAYLVVCRGGDLYASGLVVISPLEMEQRFDAATNQVRVFVKEAATGRCLGDARVEVLPRGPNVQANAAGTTDLRGVFVTAASPGGATIVAETAPGQYAYVASPAVANPPGGGVAQTQLPEIDPTAPFAHSDFTALENLIHNTAWEQSWADLGNARAAADFPTNLRLRVSQAQIASKPQAAADLARSLRGEPDNLTGVTVGNDESAEQKIRAALREPTSIEFAETPLKDVVDYLKDTHHIEIQLDNPALKDAGIDEATPVTKNIKGISLASALHSVLDELKLKYVIHNGVLLITTPEKVDSDEFMVTKAYPVTDLVTIDSKGTVDFPAFEDLLKNTVATKTWLDNGGTGTLSDMIVGKRALLVVCQSQEVHEQIEEMLEMLRKAGGLNTDARKLAEGESGENAAPRQRSDMPLHRAPPPQFQGVIGGMGMGGMGGMGMGTVRGTSQTPFVTSTIPVIDGSNPAGDADLLGGLKGANAANRQSKAQNLKQRQDAGQTNGMMGGMGGGFF